MEGYTSLSIDLALHIKGNFDVNIFIRLKSGKLVKVVNRGQEHQVTLAKYKDKGLDLIWVLSTDYARFLKNIQKSFQSSIWDPDSISDGPSVIDGVKNLNRGFKLTKEAIIVAGIDSSSLDTAKMVTKNSIKTIKKVGNIFKFFKQFKEECEAEYMKALLVGFTASGVIDQFSWASESIKEKVSLSAMLCDVVLSPAEIVTMLECRDHPGRLPESIKEHPNDVARLLAPQRGQEHLIAPEVLTIIKQHHEKPDGKGYPNGVRHHDINLLSAIYIVTEDFVESLIQCNFDHTQREKIIKDLEVKYDKGSFKKATKALFTMA